MLLLKICDSANASFNSSIFSAFRLLRKSSLSAIPNSSNLFVAVKRAIISARPDSPDQSNSESIVIVRPSGSSTVCSIMLMMPPML